MEELKETALEFLDSGKDNLEKERYNASFSDFFKTIAIFCDYLLYKEAKLLPKNHTERFSLLKKYFPKVYNKVSNLFSTYRRSYNIKISKTEVLQIMNYAYELKKFIEDRKEI